MNNTYNVSLTREQIDYLKYLLEDAGELVASDYYENAVSDEEIEPNEDGSFTFYGVEITDPEKNNTNTKTLENMNAGLMDLLIGVT